MRKLGASGWTPQLFTKVQVEKEIWFVHDRRSEGLVARKWLMHRGAWLPTHELVRDCRLEKLRAKLPLGLTRRDPRPTDAASVIEIWG